MCVVSKLEIENLREKSKNRKRTIPYTRTLACTTNSLIRACIHRQCCRTIYIQIHREIIWGIRKLGQCV